MARKPRRTYQPRILGDGKVMMPADLKRLHKYMMEIEGITVISDEMRTVVEEEWPELAHNSRRRSRNERSSLLDLPSHQRLRSHSTGKSARSRSVR